MIDLTPEDEQRILEELQRAFANVQQVVKKELEFRVYYDDEGKIITYTTENLEGNYIVISRDQFNLARHDARVIKGKLVYVHLASVVFKIVKSTSGPYKTNKLDMSVLVDEDDEEFDYCEQIANESGW